MTTAAVRLDDLIAAVAHAHPDPLERLQQAVALGSHLDDVADALIGHFVDQARRSGASWTDIGASMGVSKQAVQKRFTAKAGGAPDPSAGFSAFTEGARLAVVASQEEARTAGHDRITVAHLLLGLLADPSGSAAQRVTGQGLDLDVVRATARKTLPEPAAAVPALIPFDAHAKRALEQSFGRAEELGAARVGTEHVLLAVAAVEDGTGVLAGLGFDPAAGQGGTA
ncbi:Clp amino terminal domain-containing protein, pathogenicity island component [Friedmanniella luteola]|uniref:Clp amino terminal domain-containing protein, pathogenicity island component n=1 Tax=Friedmanniella luteola TaxID=546871 RepID=A0A1H1MLZ4_9ACTN|nr:Clp protease N-terminal domain-containing protein [Friedmanniella luteola]SDR86959.1 Clp amino terminal domain-containing protein, pathogenicity island component [Friedmanniella luteola]